ncbi:MAG TPA: hypothetical protein VGL55_10235 [Steroidobacteraceae bacterium]
MAAAAPATPLPVTMPSAVAPAQALPAVTLSAQPVAAGAPRFTARTTGRSAGGVEAGNGAAAHEVPDGSDDDIIARRLRRAAESETDPGLKGKLWKEYVDYRDHTQR